MNAKLQHGFEKLERDRLKLLEELSGWSPSKLIYTDDPQRWSVSQILLHLLTSEQLTLRYLKKKSLGINELGHSGVIEWLKMRLLVISQRLPFMKFNAPPLLIEATPKQMDLQLLTNQWDLSRRELRDFFAGIDEKNLTKLVYKHPAVGMMNLLQCQAFLYEHFRHHLRQINRIR